MFLALSLKRGGNLNCTTTALIQHFAKLGRIPKRKMDILPFPRSDSAKAKDVYLRAYCHYNNHNI